VATNLLESLVAYLTRKVWQ